MKAEYYPRVAKSQLFPQGLSLRLVAKQRVAAASRLRWSGSACRRPVPWIAGLHSCIAPFVERYHDGSIDMGTNFDCMDPLSRASETLGAIADSHRAMLADLLEKYGFKRYGNLWWSFVLADEPFPKTRFDFPVTAK